MKNTNLNNVKQYLIFLCAAFSLYGTLQASNNNQEISRLLNHLENGRQDVDLSGDLGKKVFIYVLKNNLNNGRQDVGLSEGSGEENPMYVFENKRRKLKLLLQYDPKQDENNENSPSLEKHLTSEAINEGIGWVLNNENSFSNSEERMVTLWTIIMNSVIPVDLSGAIGNKILQYVMDSKVRDNPQAQSLLQLLCKYSTKLQPAQQLQLNGKLGARILIYVLGTQLVLYAKKCMKYSAKHAVGNQFDLSGAVGAKALKEAIDIDILNKPYYGFVDILMGYAPKGSNCHLNLGSDTAHEVVEYVVKKHYSYVLKKLVNYQPKNGKDDYKVNIHKTNSQRLNLLAVARQQLKKDKNNNKEKCQEIINLLENYATNPPISSKDYWSRNRGSKKVKRNDNNSSSLKDVAYDSDSDDSDDLGNNNKGFEENRTDELNTKESQGNSILNWENAAIVGVIMLVVVVVVGVIVLIRKKYRAC